MTDHRSKIAIRNVLRPDSRPVHVDAAKYGAMRDAILTSLPASSPGLTVADLKQALLPLLPQDLFPGGDKAGWWLKAAQLDLEAQGIIAREDSKPLRLHRR